MDRTSNDLPFILHRRTVFSQGNAGRGFGSAVEKAGATAKDASATLQCHVMVGHEVKTIVGYIKSRVFDLLVIGFMGHSAIYNRIMGGTCQNLMRLVPCSVSSSPFQALTPG